MTEMTEDFVERLLDAFYAKVRRDPELAPVFEGIIRDRWPEHMLRIKSFWLTALRISSGYHGPDFMPAHLRHASIQATQLTRWLALFEETVQEMAPADEQARLMRIAHAMAENLQIGLERRDRLI
jgi:hemoglobin